MLNSKEIVTRAKEIYMGGVCCSESVIYAIAEAVEPDNAINYMKMASGLCGGMGIASVCGVVTGGSCAIGMCLGRVDLEQPQAVKCSTISRQFFNEFRNVFGETGCSELKSAIPEGCEPRDFCVKLVEKGTELAVEAINRNSRK